MLRLAEEVPKLLIKGHNHRKKTTIYTSCISYIFFLQASLPAAFGESMKLNWHSAQPEHAYLSVLMKYCKTS